MENRARCFTLCSWLQDLQASAWAQLQIRSAFVPDAEPPALCCSRRSTLALWSGSLLLLTLGGLVQTLGGQANLHLAVVAAGNV